MSEKFDLALLERLQALIAKGVSHERLPFQPYRDYALVEQERECEAAGQRAIERGEVGALLIAGGEGSRLRFSGPKGCYPISQVRGKSLFQLFAEKVIAASERAGRPLPLAIMTSPSRYSETLFFFEKEGWFGLEREQVALFAQSTYPLLDERGDLFFEDVDTIAVGPNGNGMALHEFARAGLLESWSNLGVRHLNFLPVDNPLADPYDPLLVGFHLKRHDEVTLKCAERASPSEKVGLVVSVEGLPRVVEYSEVSNLNEEYRCANLTLFCFSFEFIERVVLEVPCLPFHMAHKATRVLMADGESRLSAGPICWKFEHFIFDLLPYANSLSVLLYPRDEIFAPLKEEADIELVRAQLQRRDREVFAAISGARVDPERRFELDQAFYYPTQEILERWRGRELPFSDYVVSI